VTKRIRDICLPAGVAVALVLARVMSSLLFGFGPGTSSDALTFAGVSAGALAVALLACYIPARRDQGGSAGCSAERMSHRLYIFPLAQLGRAQSVDSTFKKLAVGKGASGGRFNLQQVQASAPPLSLHSTNSNCNNYSSPSLFQYECQPSSFTAFASFSASSGQDQT